jgi:hypothetical protein
MSRWRVVTAQRAVELSSLIAVLWPIQLNPGGTLPGVSRVISKHNANNDKP